MDKELRDRWVAALRSGRYKQGKWDLRDGDKFCCLGVLADLVDPEGWEGCSWNDCFVYVPSTILPEDKCRVLAVMNDHQSLSFSEIADYIERNL